MAETMDRARFSRWLRGLRSTRSVTQEEVARLAGLSVQHYNKIETGATGTRRATIQRLAVALDADVAEAFREAGLEARVSGGVKDASLRNGNVVGSGPQGGAAFQSASDSAEAEAHRIARRLADACAERFRQQAGEFVEQFARDISEAVFETALDGLEKDLKSLQSFTSSDALTGLNNRVAFEQLLQREFVRARRYGVPLSLLLIDVDSLRTFNNARGHEQGDMLLQNLARTLEHQARRTDAVARLAGDEFAVILPHTDEAAATVLARRYRTSIRRAPWNVLEVTVSAGIAVTTPQTRDQDQLIYEATAALRRAKDRGKDRVTLYEPDDGGSDRRPRSYGRRHDAPPSLHGPVEVAA